MATFTIEVSEAEKYIIDVNTSTADSFTSSSSQDKFFLEIEQGIAGTAETTKNIIEITTSVDSASSTNSITIEKVNDINLAIITDSVIGHPTISAASSVDNNGSLFIQDILLDQYGHITGINSAYATGTGIGGGASTFLDLTDTPSTFIGNNSKVVAVNPSASALEFISGVLISGTDYHPSINAASSSDNSGQNFIQDILLDSYGHITGIVVATASGTGIVSGSDIYITGITYNSSISELVLTHQSGSVTGILNNVVHTGDLSEYATTGELNSVSGYLQDQIDNIPEDTNTFITGIIYSTEQREMILSRNDGASLTGDIGVVLHSGDYIGFLNNSGLYALSGSHIGISAASDTSNSGSVFIQNLLFDTYGHVTGVSTALASGTGINTDTYATNLVFNSGNNELVLQNNDSSTITGVLSGVIISGDDVSHLYNDIGYITGFTETDPIFTGSPAYRISTADIANWNDSYGWGDHSTSGYLVSGDNISALNNDVPYAISGSHIIVNAASNSDNSGNIFIQDILVDEYGHITGLDTASVSIYDYYVTGITFNSGNNTLILSRNDSNAVTGILSGVLVSGTNYHISISAASDTDNTGRTYIQDIFVDEYGHVTGLAVATETFVDTDTTYTDGTGLVLVGTEFNIDSSVVQTGDNISVLNNDAGYITGFTETLTSLTGDSVNTKLIYTDENGVANDIDLSWAIDDTNLSRLVSGSIDSSGIATFTRDDASFFTVDFSVLFDDTNLSRITSGNFDTSSGILTLTRELDDTSVSVNFDGRYLQSYTETDPIFTGSPSYNITTGDITNWNESYGWGDHSLSGYLVSGDNISLLTNDIGYITSGNFPLSGQLVGDLDLNNYNIIGTGNIIISGDITAQSGYFDVISFNVDDESILTKGQISWDDTEGTMDIGLTDNTSIHIGSHRYFRVRNSTGGTLYKGQAVYATGVHSNGIIEPAKYVADGSIREVYFMGLMLEDVSNNSNGYAIDFGHLEEMDLDGSATNFAVGDETWNAGDILYIHPTVAGKLTNVEPKHSISAAIILDPGNGNGNGRMFVRPTSYGHLSDNHDVDVSGLLDNQLLVYNSGTDYWQPSSGLHYVDGDLGIGTASPSYKLDIRYTSGGGMALIKNSDSSDGLLFGDMAYSANNTYQGIKHAAMTPTTDYMIKSEGVNTFISSTSTGSIFLRGGSNGQTNEIRVYPDNPQDGSGVVINEQGRDSDFRVEGDTDQNLLFTDASTDRIGIGTSSPQAKLDVNGTVQFDDLVRWEHPDKLLDSGIATLGYMRLYDEAGGYAGLGVSASNFNIGTSGAINLRFVVNAEDRMICNTAGNNTLYYDAGQGLDLVKSTDSTDGLHFGDKAYSTSNAYQGIKHLGMTGSSDYMMVSEGLHTFISAKATTGSVWIRGGGNYDTNQIKVYPSTLGPNNASIEIDGRSISEIVVNQLGNNVDFRVEGDEDENLLFTDASADSVGIGTATPTRQFHTAGSTALIAGGSAYELDISASAATLGRHRLQLLGTETVFNQAGGNVDFRVEGDSDPYLLFADASTDKVGVGTASPAGKFSVYQTTSNQSYQYGSYLSANHYSTSGGTRYLFGNYTDMRRHVASGITDNGYMMGHDIVSVLSDEGSLGSAIGLRTYAGINNQSDNGNLTVAYGIQSRVINYSQGTGNINTARGIDVYINGDLNSPGNGGITNAYGVYIQSILNSTNTYGIYQVGSSDKNYFNGSVGIGTPSPSYKLDVAGSGHFDDNISVGLDPLSDHFGLEIYKDKPHIIQRLSDPSGAIVHGNWYGNDEVRFATIAHYGPEYSGNSAFNIGPSGSVFVSYVADIGIGTLANDSLIFGTYGTERARINPAGNFGIGTDNPSAKLNVENGNVVFNDLGGNYDFRVEGDSDPNVLVIDASSDKVGIGGYPDDGKLTIDFINTNDSAKDAIYINNICNSTSNGSYQNAGIDVLARKIVNSGVTDTGQIIGLDAVATLDGDGHLNNAYGARTWGGIYINQSGTLTNAWGIQPRVINAGYEGSLISDARGIDISIDGDLYDRISSDGITNAKALYIRPIKDAANKYGIYQEGSSDDNYFAGDVGLGVTSPSARLDINSNKFRLRTAKTPSSSSGTGNTGDICWDGNYIYVCVATNTWKRSSLSTW